MHKMTRESLRRKGIDLEAHVFFVQRWHELFSEDTHDSWQVRTCNCSTLLGELLEVIEVSEGMPAHYRNAEFIIAELEEVACEDTVIRKHFPFFRECLERLRHEHHVINGAKERDLTRLKIITELLIGTLKPYRNRVIQDLRIFLRNPPEKYKISLDALISILGIELSSSGYSTPFLRESTNRLTEGPRQFIDRFEIFVKQFDQKYSEYEVRVLADIPEPKQFPAEPGYKISLSSAAENQAATTLECEFLKQNPHATVIAVKVSELDPHAARRSALDRVESLISALKLHYFEKNIQVRGEQCLVLDPNSGSTLIGKDDSRLKYLKDASGGPEMTIALIKLLSRLSASDGDRLESSLQHHKLALQAATDEGRLVSLWIALECLAPRTDNSIIEAICSTIPNTLSTGYTYSTLRALSKLIRPFWRNASEGTRLELGSLYTQHGPTPAVLLKCVADKKDGRLISALNTLCSSDPLVLHRVTRLRNTMFKNPSALAESVVRHNRHVGWQLRRIYRSRNHITHRGHCPPMARHLIQHLHSYYVSSMHAVIHDLKTYVGWGVQVGLENRRFLYDRLISKLSDPGFIATVKYVIRPDSAYFGGSSDQVWSPCNSSAPEEPKAQGSTGASPEA